LRIQLSGLDPCFLHFLLFTTGSIDTLLPCAGVQVCSCSPEKENGHLPSILRKHPPTEHSQSRRNDKSSRLGLRAITDRMRLK
jgi:hypothetical protein